MRLSDDPDELAHELQALAGPSAGPNGGQIYVDGFTAGQLPPKSAIREIRINQNPFSAEYDKLGYGRIEIFTKPGTDKFHGQLMMNGNSSAFRCSKSLRQREPGLLLGDFQRERQRSDGQERFFLLHRAATRYRQYQRRRSAYTMVRATRANTRQRAQPVDQAQHQPARRFSAVEEQHADRFAISTCETLRTTPG